jgi:hypothetical protein
MYRIAMMNKYFDNKNEEQIVKPEKTRYEEKVFYNVKGIEVKFKKKKKEKRWDHD